MRVIQGAGVPVAGLLETEVLEKSPLGGSGGRGVDGEEFDGAEAP